MSLRIFFAGSPGYTNLIEHCISLTTDRPITMMQYPVPFAIVADFEKEVQAML